MKYIFEWDPAKAQRNLTKHRVSFQEASTIFSDRKAISIFDDKHSKDEDRWLTMGISQIGRLVVAHHTFLDKIQKDIVYIRIISARKATRKEALQY